MSKGVVGKLTLEGQALNRNLLLSKYYIGAKSQNIGEAHVFSLSFDFQVRNDKPEFLSTYYSGYVICERAGGIVSS